MHTQEADWNKQQQQQNDDDDNDDERDNIFCLERKRTEKPILDRKRREYNTIRKITKPSIENTKDCAHGE